MILPGKHNEGVLQNQACCWGNINALRLIKISLQSVDFRPCAQFCASVSWPPSELTIFGHGLLILLISCNFSEMIHMNTIIFLIGRKGPSHKEWCQYLMETRKVNLYEKCCIWFKFHWNESFGLDEFTNFAWELIAFQCWVTIKWFRTVGNGMVTSSNGNIFLVTGLLWGEHRSSVDSPHISRWRGALMFSLIYDWTSGWTNNRDTDDLRRQRANHDVIVMGNGKSDVT